nr:ABC transporter ATP-binding protein [Aquamicrobium sp. LC103]
MTGQRMEAPLQTNEEGRDMAAPLLSIRNLTTSFRNDGQWSPVVRDVSFDIRARETLAVVGESGSGKSVTAMSVLRLLPPASSRIEGRITFDGKDLTALSDEAMRAIRGNDIAMIFQEASLNPVYKIGFQLAEVLVEHRAMSQTEAQAESVRLLDRVRIPSAKNRLDAYPHNLSGGMRQRVAIAMALACQPKLLIADEPTTALDVTIQAQIIELIKTLQQEDGMSVLFITHDMGVVAEVSDRTVVMYRGELVEADTTAEIFSRASHPYTRALLASIPHLGSMRDRDAPLSFPLVDHQTGAVSEPKETVARPNQQAEPLLAVRGLKVRFNIRSGILGGVSGRVHAVEDVSFDVKPGETLSLVGESGCGKSTTARAIMGLAKYEDGGITFNGKPLAGLTGQEQLARKRDVQMVFQDPFASLNPRMTVGQALSEPLAFHTSLSRAGIRARVYELLEGVGLHPDMASRYPHQFSGGQLQRIAIARALALEPKLLIADEAVSALDVSVKAQIVNLMIELQERLGLSYLFISHDMAVVERVSHRVAVMYLGEIVEIGPRQAVFGNPAHPYTRELMSAVPVPDPQRRATETRVPARELRSPIRAPDFQAPKRMMLEVGPGHFAQADSDGIVTQLTSLAETAAQTRQPRLAAE